MNRKVLNFGIQKRHLSWLYGCLKSFRDTTIVNLNKKSHDSSGV